MPTFRYFAFQVLFNNSKHIPRTFYFPKWNHSHFQIILSNSKLNLKTPFLLKAIPTSLSLKIESLCTFSQVLLALDPDLTHYIQNMLAPKQMYLSTPFPLSFLTSHDTLLFVIVASHHHVWLSTKVPEDRNYSLSSFLPPYMASLWKTGV